MKTEWKSNSTDPRDLTGVGTFVFATGNVHVAFPTFVEFHMLTTLLNKEVAQAYQRGRADLKNQVAGIAI